jgi:hypothetical protein
MRPPLRRSRLPEFGTTERYRSKSCFASTRRRCARCYSACVQQRPPNFEALVRAFAEERVKFVVIGGFALILHGGRNTTLDSDFAVATDPENATALVRALAPFHPVPAHYPAGMSVIWDERSICGAVVSLRSECGHIDLLRVIPGVDSFEGLWGRSELRELQGVVFRVASVQDLIAMKREAGRPQDLAHLAELERIARAME